ncbi:MAG: hypothetical protein HC769_13445 [Cyanobacteria bacterium CRU_2_1]|nr:hypothetical protein [Cyanobacteria bacterium CRU_2_1]
MNQQPLVFKLSAIFGIALLLMRILTFPYPLWFTTLTGVFLWTARLQDFGLFHIVAVIWAIVIVGFLVMFGSSLIHLLLEFRHDRSQATLPFYTNVITILLVLSLPTIAIEFDFYANLNARESIVSTIQSGTLAPRSLQTVDVPAGTQLVQKTIATIDLPANYKKLSSGQEPGEIQAVSDQNGKTELVVFFGYNGLIKLDSGYSAFVYKADDEEINQGDLFGVANVEYYVWLLNAKPLGNHWYWISVIED